VTHEQGVLAFGAGGRYNLGQTTSRAFRSTGAFRSENAARATGLTANFMASAPLPAPRDAGCLAHETDDLPPRLHVAQRLVSMSRRVVSVERASA
jgi:hypothetical protein